MLNELQRKPKPSRQHNTHKKKTGRNKRCPKIEIEKREEKKGIKISQHQQRKEETKQHARGIRILQARKESGVSVRSTETK